MKLRECEIVPRIEYYAEDIIDMFLESGMKNCQLIDVDPKVYFCLYMYIHKYNVPARVCRRNHTEIYLTRMDIT